MFKCDLGDGLKLTLLEKRHATTLFAAIDRNRESIGAWLAFPMHTKQVSDTEAFIERSLLRWTEEDGWWALIWDGDQLVGSIGLLYVDHDTGKTELAYWLVKEAEGKGIVTCTAREFVHTAFAELGLNKIEIGAAVGNDKSAAVAKRLGFQEEGTIRSYEKLHGRFLDRTFFGLLRSEWQTS
ncbi:GNAT family N-acetyltransferase [Alkalicoccus luteus]|uniref:GNAT family N-acetyltransferase n=1 Tax=Alkalicoccus luteus TaxID=1237094 RepID=A0A969PMN8_9BACI|nr:GNAT family protein [Alkalicoccus luteus]NJP36225.1 GNAT family N-acetyltransferase [Alkalicoccus luteus]